MNKQRLLNVIKATEEGREEDFSMGYIAHTCDTPSCMAGHYAARADLQSEFCLSSHGALLRKNRTQVWHLYTELAEHFDISGRESTDLFGGAAGWYEPPRTPTRAEAIDYVKDFIAKHEAVEDLIQSTKEEQHEFVQR